MMAVSPTLIGLSLFCLTSLFRVWSGVLWLWKPAVLSSAGSTSMARWGGMLLPPLLIAGAVFTALWRQEQQKVAAHTVTAVSSAPHATSNGLAPDANEPLEVVGVGLTVESLRQMKVLEVIEAAPDDRYVVPEKEMSSSLSSEIDDKRWDDAVKGALDNFTEKWPIPTMSAMMSNESHVGERNVFGKIGEPGDDGLRIPGVWHAQKNVGYVHKDQFEKLLPAAFDFFDKNADVPGLFVTSIDSDEVRDTYWRDREKMQPLVSGEPYMHTGKHRSATFVGLTFARRSRVDWLRPYAVPATLDESGKYNYWQGPNEYFTSGEYYEKEGTIPAETPGEQAWLKKFRTRYTARAEPFKPTPWLPKPWKRGMLYMYDALATIGRLYRPVEVSYLNPDGTPMREAERNAAFLVGWQKALAALPKGTLPTRLFHNQGPSPMEPAPNNTPNHYDPTWIVPLELAIHDAGPDIPKGQRYNLPKRLGEMGVSTAYSSVAVALMASWKHMEPSAVVQFRPQGAMIIMVMPPTKAERAETGHTGGVYAKVEEQ